MKEFHIKATGSSSIGKASFTVEDTNTFPVDCKDGVTRNKTQFWYRNGKELCTNWVFEENIKDENGKPINGDRMRGKEVSVKYKEASYTDSEGKKQEVLNITEAVVYTKSDEEFLTLCAKLGVKVVAR